jgi:hypothetical protein
MANWQVQPGSALDESYLRSLGPFDIVYGWGVLHYTGAMWKSFELISIPAADTLMVAAHNDEGLKSRLWLVLKKLYSRSQWPLKKLLELVTFMLTCGKAFMFKPRKAVKKLVQLRAQARHVPLARRVGSGRRLPMRIFQRRRRLHLRPQPWLHPGDAQDRPRPEPQRICLSRSRGRLQDRA